jgi:WD40 repeat protein
VIHHWHVQSGKCIHTLKEDNDNNVFALDFSIDGKLFAAAGSDTRVYIYDEQTKQRIHIMTQGAGHLPGHANRVFTLKFHPQDHNLLLSGGWDRTI